MKLISHTRLFLLLAALFCGITGCERRDTTTFSNLATVVGARSVHASVPGPATINPEGDTATISTETHKIAVEHERVVLDGTELVKLPATAKVVVVTITKDRLLSVKADGNDVVTKQLPK